MSWAPEAPGRDSWGLTPTLSLETWGASERILAALQRFLQHASGDQAAWLVAEMNRNRIQSDAALDKILDLALAGEAAVGQVVSQLSGLEDIPAKAIPLLIQVAQASESTAMESAQAVESLMKVPSAQVLPAALQALTRLETERPRKLRKWHSFLSQTMESWYESLDPGQPRSSLTFQFMGWPLAWLTVRSQPRNKSNVKISSMWHGRTQCGGW